MKTNSRRANILEFPGISSIPETRRFQFYSDATGVTYHSSLESLTSRQASIGFTSNPGLTQKDVFDAVFLRLHK